MSGVSLSTKGMICTGSSTVISGGGGGYYEREIQLEKPKINVIKVKTAVSPVGLNLSEMENIKFEITKVVTTY